MGLGAAHSNEAGAIRLHSTQCRPCWLPRDRAVAIGVAVDTDAVLAAVGEGQATGVCHLEV